MIAVSRWAAGLPRRGALALLAGYQRYLSPMTPPTCRYYPSFSQYAVVAISRHGLLRGTGLAAWRLLRCNPWTRGGVDDVPPVRDRRLTGGVPHVHSAAATTAH